MKNHLGSPFWVVLPFNRSQIAPGAARGTYYLYLSTRMPNSNGEVEHLKVGVPLFYSKPEALDEARRMALQSRDTPVICEMVAFVELPQDVKMVVKTFNEEGETKAHSE